MEEQDPCSGFPARLGGRAQAELPFVPITPTPCVFHLLFFFNFRLFSRHRFRSPKLCLFFFCRGHGYSKPVRVVTLSQRKSNCSAWHRRRVADVWGRERWDRARSGTSPPHIPSGLAHLAAFRNCWVWSLLCDRRQFNPSSPARSLS